jgi:hypothetical protein
MNWTISKFTVMICLLTFQSCDTQPKIVWQTDQEDKPTELNEIKVYKLIKQARNADFDYSMLNAIDDNINDTINRRNLMPIFEPIRGDFEYYQFLATYKGESYVAAAPSVIKDFHDILIVKTDDNKKIIDAYQYTLEWAEVPLQYDVFKSEAVDLNLKDDLEIKELKLTRTYSWNDKNNELNQNGIIKIKNGR